MVPMLIALAGCGDSNKQDSEIPVSIYCREVSSNGAAANILLIGDSQTANMSDDIISGSYVNCGTSGSKTSDWLRDYSSAIRPLFNVYNFEETYVGLGINDVAVDLHNDNIWTGFATKLTYLVQNLQSDGAGEIYLRGILPTSGVFAYLNEGSLNYDTVVKFVAASTGTHFSDIRSCFTDWSGQLNYDYTVGSDVVGLHLNSTGYQQYKNCWSM